MTAGFKLCLESHARDSRDKKQHQNVSLVQNELVCLKKSASLRNEEKEKLIQINLEKAGAAKPTYVATDKPKKKKSKKNEELSMELEQIILEELEAVLDEKKKKRRKRRRKKLNVMLVIIR